MNGISALMKETPKRPPQPFLHVEDTVKTPAHTHNRASPEPDHPDALISDVWAPEL